MDPGRRLFARRGFRQLLAVRFASQWGDGLFQAALGGAVLFNPERQADPLAVAAGLAVLLLPYSLVGPFAGAFLDRWDRRRVLVFASLLRGVGILGLALMVGTGVDGVPLFLGALAVTGVSRFVLAGLSASLPHVVAPQQLVTGNVIAATAGAAMTAVGAACAIVLREVLGPGNVGSAWVTTIAVLGSLIGAAVAFRFRPKELGPDEMDEPPQAMVAVAHGLTDGVRAVAAVPTVAAAFGALAAHRLAFGISTLLTLLLFRYAFTDEGLMRGGLIGIGEAILIAAVGLGVAALVTPALVRWLGRATTVRIGLVVGVAASLGLAATLTLPAVLIAAFVLPTAGQIIKLCADAAVQAEIGDAVRGRVFSLYDAVFNVCYVLAVTAAALLSPPNGDAPLLLTIAAGVYVLGLVVHEWQLRRARAARATSAEQPAPEPTP